MVNDVIYEEPKLNIFQRIRKLWDEVPIYPKGFTQEYISKKELEKNMEGKEKCLADTKENKEKPIMPQAVGKENQEAEGGKNEQRIQAGPEQAGEVQKERVSTPRQDISRSGGVGKHKKEVLKFADFKNKKSFETDNYEVIEKGKRLWAIATAPSGIQSWRAMKKQ